MHAPLCRMSNCPANLPAQLQAQLHLLKLPPPSQTWLQTIVAARNPPPPLPSLLMTAKTRLLASDLTIPGLIEPSSVRAISLPSAIANPTVKEVYLATDVHVQVLDIEDLSRSRWNQVEELEALERGEQTRGREVIRLPVPTNDDEHNNNLDSPRSAAAAASECAGMPKSAAHRLVLQDCRGQKVYALELIRMPEIAIGTLHIGAKVLLRRDTIVARGSILLEPKTCLILGGKVEAWQKAWVDCHIARLKDCLARADEE